MSMKASVTDPVNVVPERFDEIAPDYWVRSTDKLAPGHYALVALQRPDETPVSPEGILSFPKGVLALMVVGKPIYLLEAK